MIFKKLQLLLNNNKIILYLSVCFLAYIVGNLLLVNRNILLIYIGLLCLLIIRNYILTIIVFILIQVAPNENTKLFSLANLDVYPWDILIFILLVKIIIDLMVYKRNIVYSPVNNCIYVLFVFASFSVIYSYFQFGDVHFKMTSVSLLRTYWFILPYFFIIIFINDRRKIDMFLNVVALCIVIQGMIAILQKAGSVFGFTFAMELFSPEKAAYGSTNFRSVGTIGNPNAFSQTMILLAIVPIINLLKKNTLKDWLMICFVVVGVALSGSRTGYIGVVIMLLLFIMSKMNTKKDLTSIIIIAAISLLTFNYLSEFITSRVSEELGYRQHDTSLNASVGIWQEKYDLIVKHPFLGYGWGGSYLATQKASFVYGSSHNQYIETLVDLGVFGFFVFMLLLYVIIRQSFRLIKIKDDLFKTNVGFAYFIVLICFYITLMRIEILESGNPTSGVFWGLIGLLVSIQNLPDEENVRV